MKKICLRVNMIEDEKSKRRMMKCIAGIEGVESLTVDMKERKITVIGETDPVCLVVKLRKSGFNAELLSVGPAKQEKFEAEKGEKKVGWKRDTENRGSNHYLDVQRTEAVGGFGGMKRAIEDNEGSEKRIMEAVGGFGGMKRAIEDNEGSEKRIMEAVGGFGGMKGAIEDNKGSVKRIMEAVGGFGGMKGAIEDNEGSEKRIMEAVGGFGGMKRAIEDNEGSVKRIMEAVAGFGDFTSIEVDIEKGMVTVVGKSVPVSVALKVREMGYRAKLLSLGPATEEEDPDEERKR